MGMRQSGEFVCVRSLHVDGSLWYVFLFLFFTRVYNPPSLGGEDLTLIEFVNRVRQRDHLVSNGNVQQSLDPVESVDRHSLSVLLLREKDNIETWTICKCTGKKLIGVKTSAECYWAPLHHIRSPVAPPILVPATAVQEVAAPPPPPPLPCPTCIDDATARQDSTRMAQYVEHLIVEETNRFWRKRLHVVLPDTQWPTLLKMMKFEIEVDEHSPRSNRKTETATQTQMVITLDESTTAVPPTEYDDVDIQPTPANPLPPGGSSTSMPTVNTQPVVAPPVSKAPRKKPGRKPKQPNKIQPATEEERGETTTVVHTSTSPFTGHTVSNNAPLPATTSANKSGWTAGVTKMLPRRVISDHTNNNPLAAQIAEHATNPTTVTNTTSSAVANLLPVTLNAPATLPPSPPISDSFFKVCPGGGGGGVGDDGVGVDHFGQNTLTPIDHL